jgi:hypothetical protein
VARTYAGILGPLALVTYLVRGLIHAHHADAILFGAWVSLVVFAALGYVIGWIAGRAVEESVAARIAGEPAGPSAAGRPHAADAPTPDR